MKEIKFQIDECLKIKDEQNFHIFKVEVFTGDDSYHETDSYTLSNKQENPDELELVQQKPITPKKSDYRIRNEPGVRIHLVPENVNDRFVLEICHHKGSVYFNMKKEA